MANALYEKFYAVVRRIPRGHVATYGQVALLAGHPRHARHVGFALGALREGSRLPWHRVLNARGEVSSRTVPGYDELQRTLLEDEGVAFDPRGRVDLERHRWEPRSRDDVTSRPRRLRPRAG